MIHFTCDRCKRSVGTPTQPRYVVQVAIYSMGRVEDDGLPSHASVDDVCHDEASAVGEEDAMEAAQQEIVQRSFDFCEACHNEFLESPIGRETLASLGYSDN